MNDDIFNTFLFKRGKENCSGCAFEIMSAVIGKASYPRLRKPVQEMIYLHRKLGCDMQLKIYFMHSHLYDFPRNCNEVSDEHESAS